MADTYTTNLNLTKPEPGAAEDTWGISLNDDLDTLDAIFSSSGTQINLNPNQVNFADNKKAIFGTGSDLRIYHDGNHSYIEDAGTGNLRIMAQDFRVVNSANSESMIQADNDGAVRLYYDNSIKLATTSSGIDVTGTVVSDGLTSELGSDAQGKFSGWSPTGSTSTVHGAIELGSNASYQGIISYDGSNQTRFLFDNSWNGTGSTFEFRTNTAATAKTHLKIEGTGDISFYDDTGSTQGLFWDASTERLGIGTTSPSQELVIRSAQPTILLEDSDNNAFGSIEVSSGNINISADGGSGIASSNIDFLVDGSQKIRIDSDGQLGIGTTSPSEKLTIDAGNIALDDNRYVTWGSNTGRVKISGNESLDDIRFNTDNSERMRLTNTGLGIGTSSPTRALDVSKSGSTILANFKNTGGTSSFITLGNTTSTADQIRVGSNGTALTFSTNYAEVGRFDNSGTFIINNAGSGNGLIKINGATGSTEALIFQRGGTEASRIGHSNSAELTFSTGSGVSERMRIDSSGRVGIGTDNPVATLNVDSDAQNEIARFQGANAQLRIDNNTLNVINLNSGGSGDSLSISTNSSEAIRIDSSQNVAIGNTSAGAKLDIRQDSGTALRCEDGTGGYFVVKHGGDVGIGNTSPAKNLHITDSTSPTIRFSRENSFYWDIGHTSSDFQFISETGGTILHMNYDGNVGIGTNAPSSSIDVFSSDANIAKFTRDLTTDVSLNVSADNDGTILSTGGVHNFRVFTNNSERARIDSSGNLLVGKTSTATANTGIEARNDGLLAVTRDGDAPIIMNRKTDDGTIAQFRKDNTTVGSIATNNDDLLIYSTATGHKGLRFAGGEILPVSNAGALEDNTTDLGSTAYRFKNLQLSGVVNVAGGVQNTQTTTGFGYFNFGDTDDANVGQIGYDHTSNYMRFQVNNTEKVRIDSSGNFGIGTSSLNAKLHVSDATAPTFRLSRTGTGQIWQQSIDSSGRFILQEAASEGGTKYTRLAVDDDGDIGIGTGSPAAKLDVRAADGNGISLNIGRSDTGSYFKVNHAGNDLRIYNTDGTGQDILLGVDASGTNQNNKVGIGTATPSSALHINSGASDVAAIFESTDDYADIRLKDNSGSSYIRNAGGNLFLQADRENAVANTSIRFSVDNSEKGRLNSDGNFLIGGTFYGQGDSCAIATNGEILVARSSGTGRTMIGFRNGGTTVGTITTTDTATTYNTSSDARLKEVTGEARGLEVITKLNPVAYNWKADGKADEGLIAQEVKEIVPNAVSGSEDKHYQMDYSKLVTPLVKAIQEQQEQIESLKSEIAKLKGE